jgi:FkbM family methyltransferase
MLADSVVNVVLEQFPSGYQGTACELGAADGLFLSNTLGLEQRGWNCLCIEANPKYGANLVDNRKQTLVCGVGTKPGVAGFYSHGGEGYWASFSRTVKLGAANQTFLTPILRLDDILTVLGMASLDFLSLDVEGVEYDVLNSLGDLCPKVAVVETTNDNGWIAQWFSSRNYRRLAGDAQDTLYAQ